MQQAKTRHSINTHLLEQSIDTQTNMGEKLNADVLQKMLDERYAKDQKNFDSYY